MLPGAHHRVRLRLPGGEVFRVCAQVRGRLAAGQVLSRPPATRFRGSHGYATFFAFYFMMTGLHGIHILAGIGLLSLDSDAHAQGRIFP